MRGALERLLSPVAEVRRGEAVGALLMTLLIFLLLAAYYLLKTVREVLILSEGGAEVKSYSSAAQAVLLLFVLPAYSTFASRVQPVRLVTTVTFFFASHLVLFIFIVQAGVQVGIVYFLWVGIFNLMVIAQFWAFANDIYSEEQGRRLFPLIGIGASLGAWLGAVRAGGLIETSSPTRLLVGACIVLLICGALVPLIHRCTAPASRRPLTPVAGASLGRSDGFALIRRDRYLMLIAALMLLVNVVNTTGEYLFGRYVAEQANAMFAGTDAAAQAARQRFIGATYSDFYSAVNLTGFLLQTFVVARVFKWFGVDAALVIHPIVAVIGYLLLLRAPSLQLIGMVKTADNSLDYSLGNTTRQILWLPTSREAKYKAKQAIDSFFVRAGDVTSAGVVFAGERLAFTVPTFSGVVIALIAAWLAVVALLTKVRAQRVASVAARPQAAETA